MPPATIPSRGNHLKMTLSRTVRVPMTMWGQEKAIKPVINTPTIIGKAKRGSPSTIGPGAERSSGFVALRIWRAWGSPSGKTLLMTHRRDPKKVVA